MSVEGDTEAYLDCQTMSGFFRFWAERDRSHLTLLPDPGKTVRLRDASSKNKRRSRCSVHCTVSRYHRKYCDGIKGKHSEKHLKENTWPRRLAA